MRSSALRLAVGLLGCLGVVGAASANSGIQLPLNQYQAGTENVTLVNNGNFESVSGSDATVWTEAGNMTTAAPVFAHTSPSVNGSFAAQALGPSPTDLSAYSQNLSFTPATAYVLSAYMWNNGVPGPAPHTPADFDPGDQALVELVDLADANHKVTLELEPIALDGGSGADGYFVYDTVPADAFPSGARLDIKLDLDTAGPWGSGPVVQFDNIALTPAGSFQPPALAPEPSSLAMLALAVLGLRRRR